MEIDITGELYRTLLQWTNHTNDNLFNNARFYKKLITIKFYALN